MARFSYSRVGCFKSCPYQYYLRYIEGLKTIPNQDPDNALYLGTALHTGLEKNVDAAIKQYYSNYYCLSDKNVDEAIKLEDLIPKANKLIPVGEHEIQINDFNFVGFIDLLVEVENGVYDMYDFKYSNAVDRYLQSPQLSIYKYFYEKTTGNKIRNMYFLFVPKTRIRQKREETIHEFRKRLRETLSDMEPFIRQVDYDIDKVVDFQNDIKEISGCTNFSKNTSSLCRYCDYESYCISGSVIDILPKEV